LAAKRARLWRNVDQMKRQKILPAFKPYNWKKREAPGASVGEAADSSKKKPSDSEPAARYHQTRKRKGHGHNRASRPPKKHKRT